MKIQLLACAAIILMGSTTNAASAQTQLKRYHTEIAKADTKKPLETGIDEKEVDMRAVRRFRKTYPEAGEAIWRKSKDLYFVTFTQDGIRHKISYNHKGDENYSIKILQPEQLPGLLRRNIRSNFYDDVITTAQELRVGHRKIYLVQLSGAKEWKTLRIEDGDMEVMNRLQKQ